MELPTPPPGPLGREEISARQWGLIIHLSVLAGYIVPLAGFVTPVVLWQLKKHDHPMIDAHGKNVANWLLSLLIYGTVAFLLVFVLIGIPLLWLLGILNIVFAIVGGIKANDGVVWAYPFTIRFLS
jgi:uncharacterized Tic20 family protein